MLRPRGLVVVDRHRRRGLVRRRWSRGVVATSGKHLEKATCETEAEVAPLAPNPLPETQPAATAVHHAEAAPLRRGLDFAWNGVPGRAGLAELGRLQQELDGVRVCLLRGNIILEVDASFRRSTVLCVTARQHNRSINTSLILP